MAGHVLRLTDLAPGAVEALLRRFGLSLVIEPDGQPITGSYWGDEEAGIVGRKVYARSDTPIHSLLHESCHTICMTAERREALHRDAGGDDLEEAAVCYLQILLADAIAGVGRARLMRDMDTWGYSFRLGSTARWFVEDADDARKWLINKGLIREDDQPAFRLRH
jgi:hypothetical protein